MSSGLHRTECAALHPAAGAAGGGTGGERQAAAPTIIVGLGRTGLSCARYLRARGEAVEVMDSRAHPPGLDELRALLPEVPVHTGGFAGGILQRAGRVVVSPGVALREPAIDSALAAGIPVLGDVELFARGARAPVVAITGSNGKSTVTALVGEMARAAGRDVRVGGNLGTPVLDLAGVEEPELYVLELSSFQLETTCSLRAAAATVLNLSADHLDRYAGMDEYAAAKRRVFRGHGTMVINLDDPRVAAMREPARAAVGFGTGEPGSGDFGLLARGGETWLARGGETLLRADALALKGLHNAANALAALALGHAVGLPMEPMLAALTAFRGLPHRCQLVAEARGVRWYDDSKATNPGATLAAIRGMVGDCAGLVLIAGGDGKGADFTELGDYIAGHVRAAVLLGRDAPAIESAIARRVPVLRVADMDAAVRAACELARGGDCVLLAPACASLDMYSSYEERGRVFVAAVRAETRL